MPVSDQDHMAALLSAEIRRQDDLRAAEQKAVVLLAAAEAARTQAIVAGLIAIASLAVAMLRH